MDFIENALTKYKLKKRDLLEALLISEEVLIQLSEKAIEDSTIQVTVKKWLGVPRIKFISSGDAIDIGDQASVVSLNELDNSEDSIRNMMLQSFADSIRYQHTKSKNYVTIITGIPDADQLIPIFVELHPESSRIVRTAGEAIISLRLKSQIRITYLLHYSAALRRSAFSAIWSWSITSWIAPSINTGRLYIV